MTYCQHDRTGLIGVFSLFLLASFFSSRTWASYDYTRLRDPLADDYDVPITDPDDNEPSSETSECSFGWQSLGDHCYLYVKTPGKQWNQAEKYCSESVAGGHLVSIHSKDEMDFIFALIMATGTHWYHKEHQRYHSFTASNDFVWVGLAYMCPEPSKGRWSDGSRLNSSIQIQAYGGFGGYGSSYSSSSTIRGQQRCVSFHLSSDGGKLTKGYCLDYAPFLCKAPKDGNKTRIKMDDTIDDTEMDSLCGSYDWCYHNDSCYKILTKEQSWHNSRGDCRDDGGELVSVHSVSEIDYLNNNLTIDWSAGNTFWTGLNKLESMDDRFQWSDNSAIDFLPAITVERGLSGTARNPSCVSMRVSQLRRLLAKSAAAGKMRAVSDGELQLSRCDTVRPAVCKKPSRNSTRQSKSSTLITSSNIGGCAKGWILFRDRCYKAFGAENATALERTNFSDAQQTCIKYKANLVSLRDDYDNLFVLSMITENEVNQTWIGLIHNDGRLKWIDETQVTYTNFDAVGMITFGAPRTTPSPISRSTTPYYSGLFRDPSSGYYWRQSDRCFVMSIDKAPGTWDAVTSTGTLTSIISRSSITLTPTSGYLRGKRSMYLPYDYWRRSSALNAESCERQKLSFVCEKSKAANETSGDQEWYCDALNSNYYKLGSNCYQIINEKVNWQTAKEKCEKSSPRAALVSVLNHREYAFLASLMKKTGDDLRSFWIGMEMSIDDPMCPTRTEKCKASGPARTSWVDNWPVWFTKWDKALMDSNGHGCVYMGVSNWNEAPVWQIGECEKKLPFVCKHRPDGEKPPKQEKSGRCDAGWLVGSTQCYSIMKDDWTTGANAMLRCWREHNASLASFPTESDWTLIAKNQEVKESKRRFFIGLMQKVHGNFEWFDGSPMEFVNWAPDEPRYGWNPSVEVCVEMDQNGLWYDAGCHETRHFICSKSKIQDESESSTVPELTTKVSISSTSSTTLPSTESMKKIPTKSIARTTRTTSTSKPSITSSTVSQNSSASNQSKLANVLGSTQSKPATSRSGVIAGIVICVLFVFALIAMAAGYVYRRHTQGMPLFRRRSSDAMRFEILNERQDDY